MTSAASVRARKHATRLSRALDQDALLAAELADAHGRLLATGRRLAVAAVDQAGLLEMDIHTAHAERVAETRRRLALKIGGLSARLADELHAAGWTDTQTRHANAHELAGARTPPATGHQSRSPGLCQADRQQLVSTASELSDGAADNELHRVQYR